MPLGRPDVDMKLWQEGDAVDITLTRIDDANCLLEWNRPDKIEVYDGVVIVLSKTKLEPRNFPIDGNRYTSTQDLSVPADMISDAYVVAALYGDKLTTNMNVTGLEAGETYYASVHVVTNTLSYFSDGKYSYADFQETKSYTGNIEELDEAPLNPYLGQTYYSPINPAVQMWDGSEWIDTKAGTVPSGQSNPPTAKMGEYFHNQRNGRLYVWATKWVVADTQTRGIPTYMTPGIGTDASSDEFAVAINNIKRMLGYPVVCVELQEEQFNIALDNAISEFRRRADNAYIKKYIMFRLKKGESTYYLNDPATGTDKIVDVIGTNRTNAIGLQSQTGDDGLYYSQAFLNNYYSAGAMDLTSIYALHEYGDTFNRLFAGDLAFHWREATRELTIHQRIHKDENIVLEVACEKTEQELLVDRWSTQWIEGWAKAECLQTLGFIRTKYASLPGAGGGVQLNGNELLAQASADFEDLKRQIMDSEAGNNGAEFGASFVIG